MKANDTKPRSFAARWLRRLAILAAVFGIFALLHWWSGPIRPLLFSASDIHDSYDGSGGGITGDFNRCIRARCTEDAFHRYARHQGLTETIADALPEACPGWSSCSESWWTPPTLRGAYYSYRPGGSRRILAYADGLLFYDSCAW